VNCSYCGQVVPAERPCGQRECVLPCVAKTTAGISVAEVVAMRAMPTLDRDRDIEALMAAGIVNDQNREAWLEVETGIYKPTVRPYTRRLYDHEDREALWERDQGLFP
jgi:hypothetical protein